MKRTFIKLTESDLRRIVKESVNRILKETNSNEIEEILDNLAWKEASRVCQSDFSKRRDENWEQSYNLARKAAKLIYDNPRKFVPDGVLPPPAKLGLNNEIVKKVYDVLGLDINSELKFIKNHSMTSYNIEGVFLDVLRYLLFDMKELGYI